MAVDVARRRLERGVTLNHPEAIALITAHVVEGARDGRSVAELMESALMLADSRFPGAGTCTPGDWRRQRRADSCVRRTTCRPSCSAGCGRPALPAFLLGRLRTVGTLSAVFAAAAAAGSSDWSIVDAELDARTPSAAQRSASRAQGRATARAAGVMVVHSVDGDCGEPLRVMLSATPHPHHAVVLGVLAGAPEPAAAYLSVSGPASAGVRLLGLDPLRVNGIVWALADPIHEVVRFAVASAGLPLADPPAHTHPVNFDPPATEPDPYPAPSGADRPFRIGIGGPVGSGTTALVAALCRALGDSIELAVVTNDIYTTEDADCAW